MAKLGDGKLIPWIGFGTYLSTGEDVRSSCVTALEVGYQHIDTAEGYKTEEDLGDVIIHSKNKPFITTKLYPTTSSGPKSFDEVVSSLESSLLKLKLTTVDLYLIHAPMAGKEGRIEQWRALLYLQSIGKCSSIGVSNYSVSHLEEIRTAGLPLPAANQLELHPLCQHKDIIQYCLEHNILPIAYSSLAPLGAWRVGQKSRKSNETDLIEDSVLLLLEEMAAKYNITCAQLLLRWSLQHGYPVLPKSTHHNRIVENFDISSEDKTISVMDMNILDGLDQDMALAWASGDPCKFP